MPATILRLGDMLAYRVAPAKWGYERSSYTHSTEAGLTPSNKG